MNIFTTIPKDHIKALAMGSFDGIHLGHKKLIECLGDFGALLIIDKFKDKKLCTNEDKACLSKKQIIELDFHSIQFLDGRDFLRLLKKEFVSLEHIVVGFDFSFGKNKAYKAKDIELLSGIRTTIVDEFRIGGVAVHTSLIKKYLMQADIKRANSFLGRNYTIKGQLIRGQGLGSKKLFPTLNLECKEYFLPKNGVYASLVKIHDRDYKSVSFLGVRFSDGNFAIESYILENFDEKLSIGAVLKLEFVAFIRENRRFDDFAQLKEQILKDIQRAKECLGGLK